MSDAPVIFDDIVTVSDAKIDCRVDAGKSLRILCATDAARTEIADLLVGAMAPRRGHVRYFGRDFYAMREAERLLLYRRVGFVPRDGGLISNLKSWENVVLPMWYHERRDASALDEQAAAFFGALGFTAEHLRAFMGLLPERTSVYEERSVALVRTWLMKPDVIVYDAPFSNLERGAATRLLDVARDVQRQTGCVSIYLLPDEPFSGRVETDRTIGVGDTT